MTDVVLVTLAFLHILAAIGWLGGAIFFLSAIGPGVRSLSPQASLEYLTKVGPKQVRFFIGTATATIVFGLVLLFYDFGPNGANWPTSLDVGFILGFIAYIIAMLVAIPAFRKVDKIAHQMMGNPQGGPPPPEFTKLLKKGTQGVIAVVIFLILATIFMVSTGF